MKKKLFFSSTRHYWLILLLLFSLQSLAQTTLADWDFDFHYTQSGSGTFTYTPNATARTAADGLNTSVNSGDIVYPNSIVGTLDDYQMSVNPITSVTLEDRSQSGTTYHNNARMIGAAPTSANSTNPANHSNYYQFSFPTTGYKTIKLEISSTTQNVEEDILYAYYSVDGGTTWINNGQVDGHTQWWVPQSTTLELDATNKSNVIVRLIGIQTGGSTGNNFYLDSFKVTGVSTALPSSEPSNTSSNLTWDFDLGISGQSATTDGYMFSNNVTVGSNFSYSRAYGSGSGAPSVTFSYLINGSGSTSPAGADPGNLVGFEFTTLPGVTFTPTNVSFNCQRHGTGSGLIDVYWKSSDGTSTLIALDIKPNRDNAAVVPDGETIFFTIDVSGLSISALGGKSTLEFYLHSLGNGKEIGLANISVDGILNGSLPHVWEGTTSDWATGTNWAGGSAPLNANSVLIRESDNDPIISSSTGATFTDLTIESGSLTIEAGGSLIVTGNSIGDVTYNRTLNFVSGNTNGWHLVSSPVASEVFDNIWTTNNSIASGSSSNLGVAMYNTSGNSWTYLQSPSGSMSSIYGMGYSMKRNANGNVAFTGTINTADVNDVAVSTADNGFNLLGNPYTSYISSQTFLNTNTNTTGQIWTWTEGGGYTARPAIENFIIAPGQGFFVSVTSGSTVDFSESNQASGTDNFQKSERTEINLVINDGKLNRTAKLLYFETNVTKGFDWGYEGKTFTAFENEVEVYTHLLDSNVGNKYQVQSLPTNGMDSFIIPVGIKASAGEITFSADAINLPSGLKVFLEDRENNTFTRLDEANSEYKVTLSEDLDGIGRFYLHTKSSALSTDTFNTDNISVYPTNKSTLKIVGLSQGKTNVKLFNILGKQVLNSSFTSNGVYDVNLPELATGVYIVQLESENGTLNKKIVLE